MPRYARIVLPECPHHVTQRGNHRQAIFKIDDDRAVYLDLLQFHAKDCDVRILGYCLMPNHVHWIVTPQDAESLSHAFGRAHYRYSNYFQAKQRTSGHLWQGRFYSCALSRTHACAAMRYVEQNPVRAGLAAQAEEYEWSSARPHVVGYDPRGVVDVDAWASRYAPEEWREILRLEEDRELRRDLERCTYGGKPLGDDSFRREAELLVGHEIVVRGPGRPKKAAEAKLTNC